MKSVGESWKLLVFQRSRLGLKEELQFKTAGAISPGRFWWAAAPGKFATMCGRAQERAVSAFA